MVLKIKQWVQQEALLVITFLLAIASTFIVAPSLGYLSYIDWDTLALLMALMIVMAGFKALGLFSKLGEMLLSRVKSQRSIEIVLISACFFSSMIITNDVALITFVPFAIETLNMANMKDKLLPVVVLQTIAANLGSMVTPIGNPQNIYLYFQSGFSALEFLSITLPFAVVSFGLLMLFIHAKKNKPLVFENHVHDGETANAEIAMGEIAENHTRPAHTHHSHHCYDEAVAAMSASATKAVTKTKAMLHDKESKAKFAFYGAMFALCLLSLTRVFSVCIVALVVVALTLVIDRKILAEVDYSLLLTFVNFFIFVGNMQSIPMLSEAIISMVSGNEIMATIGISQVISNVPAVLLLTGFTKSWKLLIIGSNLGGLGTMIASMASLISFKYVAKERPNQKLKYLIIFTIANVIFLLANLAVLVLM